MSNKLFQNVVQRMRGATERVLGVIDDMGVVVACSDDAMLGRELGVGVIEQMSTSDVFFADGYTYRSIGSGATSDSMIFVEGEDELARTLSEVLSVSFNTMKEFYDEKYDKTNFMQNIIFDNLLAFDLHQKARELHVDIDTPRAVLYVKTQDNSEAGIYEVIRNMFPDKEKDFVVNIDANNIVLIKELKEAITSPELEGMAQSILDTINSETMNPVLIGIGTVANNIDELNNSYKEAQIALEVGKVFDEEKTILNYDNLGIGRLIYQLPIKLCELFLQEVFKKGDISTLDDETILTINKFFENDLNVSETSRQLFVHRNTLVYRLEKIYKLTGLDLRKFDQAIVFKVAMMVHKYLISNPMKI